MLLHKVPNRFLGMLAFPHLNAEIRDLRAKWGQDSGLKVSTGRDGRYERENLDRSGWLDWRTLLGTSAYNDTDMRTHSTFGEDRSLGSCDNNDSCLRNVNNLSNKSPLQRLKWKKKKQRFSWTFYVNHKNFFSKNVQCLAAILPNTLCKPIYPMSLWDRLRIPARRKYCPQDFPPATMNIIPDRLYCYRKHKETRAKRYS